MGNYCNREEDDSLGDSREQGPKLEIRTGLCNADPITKQGKRIQMMQVNDS